MLTIVACDTSICCLVCTSASCRQRECKLFTVDEIHSNQVSKRKPTSATCQFKAHCGPSLYRRVLRCRTVRRWRCNPIVTHALQSCSSSVCTGRSREASCQHEPKTMIAASRCVVSKSGFTRIHAFKVVNNSSLILSAQLKPKPQARVKQVSSTVPCYTERVHANVMDSKILALRALKVFSFRVLASRLFARSFTNCIPHTQTLNCSACAHVIALWGRSFISVIVNNVVSGTLRSLAMLICCCILLFVHFALL